MDRDTVQVTETGVPGRTQSPVTQKGSQPKVLPYGRDVTVRFGTRIKERKGREVTHLSEKRDTTGPKSLPTTPVREPVVLSTNRPSPVSVTFDPGRVGTSHRVRVRLCGTDDDSKRAPDYGDSFRSPPRPVLYSDRITPTSKGGSRPH